MVVILTMIMMIMMMLVLNMIKVLEMHNYRAYAQNGRIRTGVIECVYECMLICGDFDVHIHTRPHDQQSGVNTFDKRLFHKKTLTHTSRYNIQLHTHTHTNEHTHTLQA